MQTTIQSLELNYNFPVGTVQLIVAWDRAFTDSSGPVAQGQLTANLVNISGTRWFIPTMQLWSTHDAPNAISRGTRYSAYFLVNGVRINWQGFETFALLIPSSATTWNEVRAAAQLERVLANRSDANPLYVTNPTPQETMLINAPMLVLGAPYDTDETAYTIWVSGKASPRPFIRYDGQWRFSNDGINVSTFGSGGGGGTPANPSTSVQFNDMGAFGGDTRFTWDKITKILTLGESGGGNGALRLYGLNNNALVLSAQNPAGNKTIYLPDSITPTAGQALIVQTIGAAITLGYGSFLGGTIGSNQIPVGNGTNTVAGSGNLLWNAGVLTTQLTGNAEAAVVANNSSGGTASAVSYYGTSQNAAFQLTATSALFTASGLRKGNQVFLFASASAVEMLFQTGDDAIPFIWGTNVTERMRLNATGLGLGVSPSTRLDVGAPAADDSGLRLRGLGNATAAATSTHYLGYDPSTGKVVRATTPSGGGGGGSVTSVGLSLPSIFTVTGSPVTAAGTLTGTLNNQTANLVFAGPTSGGAATPAFRLLVEADIPNLAAAGKVNTSALTGVLAAAQHPALTGDVTNSAGTVATTIANQAVTFAKMQNVSTGILLGRSSAGSGSLEQITLGANLSLAGGVLSAASTVSYLVLSADAQLTNERVFFAHSGLVENDNGPGNNFEVTLDQAFTPTWTGLHTFNRGNTSLNSITIDAPTNATTGQTRNSHRFSMIGRSNDGTAHSAEWRWDVQMVSPDGVASSLRLQERIDGGTFFDAFKVEQGGLITAGRISSLSQLPAFTGTKRVFGRKSAGSGSAEEVLFTEITANYAGGFVSVKDYGAKGDTRHVDDAVLTSGSPTVTSATAAFTADDVGKVVYGIETASGLLRLPVGTVLSVNSGTQITCSTNGAGNYSNIRLVLGTDDTTALQAAFTDAASRTLHKANLYAPAGNYLFKSLFLDNRYGSEQEGVGLKGDGAFRTIFYAAPDFNFASTAVNQSIFHAVANCKNTSFEGFQVYGSGFVFSGTGYAAAKLGAHGDSVLADVQVYDFRGVSVGLQVAEMNGGFGRNLGGVNNYGGPSLQFNQVQGTYHNCGVSNSQFGMHIFGINGVSDTSIGLNLIGALCDECTNYSSWIENSSDVRIYASRFYAGGATNAMEVTNSTVRVHGCVLTPFGSNANSTGLKVNSGTVYLGNTRLKGSGTGHFINNAGTIIDLLGNSYTGNRTGTNPQISVVPGSSINGPTGESFYLVGASGSNINLFTTGGGVVQIESGKLQLGGFPYATGLEERSAGLVRVTNGGTGAGNLLLGTSTVGGIGTSGVGVLGIANGTAPTTSPADTNQFYGLDAAAGDAQALVRNEQGRIARLTGTVQSLNQAFPKTNATLANVTGNGINNDLLFNVETGSTYRVRAALQLDAEFAAGGVKVALGGTVALNTTLSALQIRIWRNDTNVVAASGRVNATGAAVQATGAADGSTYEAIIEGSIFVTTGGTFTVQFAQATAAGTSNVLPGSYMEIARHS